MRSLFQRVSTVFVVLSMIAGIVSTNMYHVNAANTMLTTPDISVTGYQIKTNGVSKMGVSFRTICKAPKVGSSIVIAGKNYTVKSLGTIYVKDPNRSGNNSNVVLTKSYTELRKTPYLQSAIQDGHGFKYIGSKDYQGRIVAFGYIATDEGILKTEDGETTYVRTMSNMDDFVLNSLFIRAFVEATDEDGNEVFIYGKDTSIISVAEIAYKVYMRSLAPNEEGHDYLYNAILHRLPTSNPFYKETPEEFGWGGVVEA